MSASGMERPSAGSSTSARLVNVRRFQALSRSQTSTSMAFSETVT